MCDTNLGLGRGSILAREGGGNWETERLQMVSATGCGEAGSASGGVREGSGEDPVHGERRDDDDEVQM